MTNFRGRVSMRGNFTTYTNKSFKNILDIFLRIVEAMLYGSSPIRHVKWALVTTAWRVLRLRMEETASRYGR
jgi:hypothetical protein